MAYTLTTNYDNPPSAVLTLTSDSAFSTTPLYRFKIYSDNAGTQLVANSGWITLSEASTTITYTVASINPGTYYVTAESDSPQTYVSLQQVVLADDTPKTATQSQWEDLAARVKAKADPSDIPTITMTTTDPGEGSPLAENNFVAVYGGTPLVFDYSTSEMNTGATWVDGSAIYKKTFSIGTLPSSATTKQTSHNISNLGIVVHMEGTTSNGTYRLPLPYAAPTSTDCIALDVNATKITITTGSDRSAYTTTYVTLYYTKSS